MTVKLALQILLDFYENKKNSLLLLLVNVILIKNLKLNKINNFYLKKKIRKLKKKYNSQTVIYIFNL